MKTESYIINSNHEIDVMLISIDPYDLFDDENGIYVFGEEGTYDEWVPYFGANFGKIGKNQLISHFMIMKMTKQLNLTLE